MLAEMMPFPREDTTPPVTKMYFVFIFLYYDGLFCDGRFSYQSM